MKYTLFTLFASMLLTFPSWSIAAARNPPECAADDPDCDACVEEGPENGCIMITLDLGQTSILSDSRAVTLKLYTSTLSPSIFTPKELKVVMGYTFKNIGSDRTSKGAPAQVSFVQSSGELLIFNFAEGSSYSAPEPGPMLDLAERLQMVDAEGWATLDGPVYYDLYAGDGSKWRFMATNITQERGAFISYTNPRGYVMDQEAFGVDIIRDENGVIRQVVTPSRMANVTVTNSTSYAVTVYPLIAPPTFENGAYLIPEATPTRHLEISKLSERKLLAKYQKGSAALKDFIYEYAQEDWTLTRPNNTVDKKELYFSDDRTTAQRVHMKYDVTGTKVGKQTVSNYIEARWGYAMVNRVEGIPLEAGETNTDRYKATETTHWSYITDTNNPNLGKIRQKTFPNGVRIQYAYDAMGRKTLETNMSLQEATAYSYASIDPLDVPKDQDARPRRIIKTRGDVEIERTYYAYLPNQEIVERCAESGAAYGAVNNLKTVTTWHASNADGHHAGRLASVRHEDGSLTHYTYELGNSIWIETVTQLHVNQLEAVPLKTMRSRTYYSQVGYVTERRTELLTTLDTWTVIDQNTYTYTLDGNVSQVIDLAGRITTSVWGGNCCGKTSQTTWDGITTTYTYDENERLTRETVLQPSPVEKHTTYDDFGRVIAIYTTTPTDPSSDEAPLRTPTLRTQYDCLGRVIAKSDLYGLWTETSYTNSGNTITVTYPNGSTEITNYDHGHISTISGTAVTPTIYSCGPNWTMEASGERWSKTITNMLGQTIREERSGANDSTLTTTYIHDTYGRILSTVTSGQPITTYTYNDIGEQIATTQTIGEVWRRRTSMRDYELINDSIWQMQINTGSYSDVSIPDLTQTTHMQITGLTTEKIAHQKATNGRGNLSESWIMFNPQTKESVIYQKVPYTTNLTTTRSKYGQALEETSLSGVTTSLAYDELGRMVSQTDGRGNTMTQTYNALGQVISTIDAAGNTTTYSYDDYGQFISETDALGNIITYEYDLRSNTIYEGGSTYPVRTTYDIFGNKVSMTTYRDEGGEDAGDMTTWIYDEASGTLLQERYADGKGLIYTYTNEGRRATRTDARGIVMTYAYDNWGQLTSTTYSDNTPATTSTYDAMGKTTIVQDAVGATTLTYDAYGALVQESITGQYSKNVTHHFDTYGRDIGYSIGASRQSTLSYDPATGRMIGMNAGGDFTWNCLVNTNLKSKLTYPNGATVEWAYEPKRSLLTQVKNTADSAIISQYDYTHDAIGRRTAMGKSGSMMAETDIINYGYNARNEVISADATQDANYLFNYAFDDIGNRETGEGKTYTANWLNQYTQINEGIDSPNPQPLTPNNSVESTAFAPTFDANGNQTFVQTTTGTWTVVYNAENRPIRWTQGATVITMTYDHMGRRISYKKMQGNTQVSYTKFLYKGYLCVQELSADAPWGVLKAFIWDPTESTATRPLVFTEGEQTAFYMHDGNKNVTDVISSTSSSSDVTHYDYAPFGAVTRTITATVSTQNSSPITHNSELRSANPFRFSSEYHDDDLGLIYYNYRHYNPTDGRWCSRDELFVYNEYAYVNNKTSFFDFLGLSSNEKSKRRLVEKYDIYETDWDGTAQPKTPGVVATTSDNNTKLVKSKGTSKGCPTNKYSTQWVLKKEIDVVFFVYPSYQFYSYTKWHEYVHVDDFKESHTLRERYMMNSSECFCEPCYRAVNDYYNSVHEWAKKRVDHQGELFDYWEYGHRRPGNEWRNLLDSQQAVIMAGGIIPERYKKVEDNCTKDELNMVTKQIFLPLPPLFPHPNLPPEELPSPYK